MFPNLQYPLAPEGPGFRLQRCSGPERITRRAAIRVPAEQAACASGSSQLPGNLPGRTGAFKLTHEEIVPALQIFVRLGHRPVQRVERLPHPALPRCLPVTCIHDRQRDDQAEPGCCDCVHSMLSNRCMLRAKQLNSLRPPAAPRAARRLSPVSDSPCRTYQAAAWARIRRHRGIRPA